MQKIQFYRDHFSFYSPATGEVILNQDELNESEKSLLGFWVDNETPIIKDADLQIAWEEFSNSNLIYWDSIDDFFNKSFSNNWVVFEITFSGIACGLASNTAWVVIDMNTYPYDLE